MRPPERHGGPAPEDIRRGLAARPRSIPSKYFYDDRGSALFDAICDLPEYYPTRTEQRLLDERASEIARITRASELVELGSGTARKTRALIGALVREEPELRYAPLDISRYALDEAASVADEFPGVRVDGVLCDYTRSLASLQPSPGCLAAFLGSTIGNFTPVAGVSLLRRLRERLADGDWFLLGVDLVKPVAVLEAAYNDRAGITAEFNRNILDVVNREVGGDFDPADFEHVAIFNAAASQIEMYLEARRDLRVCLEGFDMVLDIRRAERIRTEISRKFTRDSAAALLAGAGFTPRHWFCSEDGYFALALASVAGGERP
ncbi:MAG TPA: L-histidine N(alpha)-methyltransferase [Methylomirabilota bacterium]|nr:L-histidine N(alpha)-methyltransferase [Methylomirabilota bacterium]